MRVEEIVELLGADQQVLADNQPNEEEHARAEIDAAIAELQAELVNLDRRTHEIRIVFGELVDEQQAISESILSMRRQQKRGLRSAPKRALRDITRAFNKRAKSHAAVPRRKTAPVKRTAATRTQPQAPAKPIAQATNQCPPPAQKVVYLTPAHSQPVPQAPATTAALRQQSSAPLPAQQRPTPMPNTKQATAPMPPTLPTRPMPPTPPSKPAPPAREVVSMTNAQSTQQKQNTQGIKR